MLPDSALDGGAEGNGKKTNRKVGEVGMPDSALTLMMNDPYCIVCMAVVVISGCIALAIDCWRKWH